MADGETLAYRNRGRIVCNRPTMRHEAHLVKREAPGTMVSGCAETKNFQRETRVVNHET